MLLNPSIPLNAVIHVYGRPATGKTGVVMGILRHQKIRYAYVNATVVQSQRAMLQSIVRDLVTSLTGPGDSTGLTVPASEVPLAVAEVNKFSDVGRILQTTKLLRANEPFAVVVDNAPRLAAVCNDISVYANLAKLCELANRPVPIILITTGIWPDVEVVLKGSTVLQVHFPAYKEHEIERILFHRLAMSNPDFIDLLVSNLGLSTGMAQDVQLALQWFVGGHSADVEQQREVECKDPNLLDTKPTNVTGRPVGPSVLRILDILSRPVLRIFCAYVVGVLYHSTRDLLEMTHSAKALTAILGLHILSHCISQSTGASGASSGTSDFDQSGTLATLPLTSLPRTVLAELRPSSRSAVKGAMFHEIPLPPPKCLHDVILPFVQTQIKSGTSVSNETASCSASLSIANTRADSMTSAQNDFAQSNAMISVSSLPSLLELPQVAKYLIFAAALAAYSRSKDDTRLFANEGGRRNRRKTLAAAALQNDQGIAAGAPLPATLAAGQSFTIERLLNIFAAISDSGVQELFDDRPRKEKTLLESAPISLHDIGIPPSLPFGLGTPLYTADSKLDGPAGLPYDALLSKIGLLVSAGALAWASARSRDDPLNDARILCTVPLDDVRKLAAATGFNIDVYLPA